MKEIIWFVRWEKGNNAWGFINGDGCIMFNVGRFTIGIQKPLTWKYLITKK